MKDKSAFNYDTKKELEEGTLVEIEMPPDLYIPKREIVFLYDEKNINPSLGKFLNILKA